MKLQELITLGERMPGSIIKHKQKLANMTDQELADRFKDFDETRLRQMAWRHGYGKMSPYYWDRVQKGKSVSEAKKPKPTNPSKWSYYKSQAKQKFDVYPSAYANGWASKQYKAAGGGWKQCAGESMENTNENFAVHMMVAKAIADQKVKNPETKKDVRVTTALKDKQHPAHGKAKSLVQRLKDKFSKKESIDEKMITPQRGHNYYQLYRDTPIKYVSGHSGIGLKVPGVLLHNEYDTIKGKEGAYIIDYFGAHFYLDRKNKFASRIAHPDNREQNKDLRKNMGRTALAPEHKDWKKYMNESVNEEFQSKDRDFEKVYAIFDKKDYFNA